MHVQAWLGLGMTVFALMLGVQTLLERKREGRWDDGMKARLLVSIFATATGLTMWLMTDVWLGSQVIQWVLAIAMGVALILAVYHQRPRPDARSEGTPPAG